VNLDGDCNGEDAKAQELADRRGSDCAAQEGPGRPAPLVAVIMLAVPRRVPSGIGVRSGNRSKVDRIQ
jgi:hypothetical protein